MKFQPANLWNAAETEIVRQMTAQQRPAIAIAAVIGRSATAVRLRRRILGISPGRHNNGKRSQDRGTRVECLIETIEQAVKQRRRKAYIRELRLGLIVLMARERGL